MTAENDGPKRKQNPGMMVRMPPEDWRLAEKIAISYGETIQRLFRRFIHGVEIPKVVLHPEGSREILIAINRVGTNINQIARRINEGSRAGWYHEFQEASQELAKIRELIGSHLGYCHSARSS